MSEECLPYLLCWRLYKCNTNFYEVCGLNHGRPRRSTLNWCVRIWKRIFQIFLVTALTDTDETVQPVPLPVLHCSLPVCRTPNTLISSAKIWTKFFYPWRWKQYVPPEHRYQSTSLHVVRVQKIAFCCNVVSYLPSCVRVEPPLGGMSAWPSTLRLL